MDITADQIAQYRAAFVTRAVQAILSYYRQDQRAILSFYVRAELLRGKDVLVDAILDGVDSWIVEQTWTSLNIPTVEEVWSWEEVL